MDTTEYHLQHVTQTLRALEAKRGDVPDLMYMSIVNSVLAPYNVSLTDVPALEGFVGNLLRALKNHRAARQEAAKLKVKTLAKELTTTVGRFKTQYAAAKDIASNTVKVEKSHALFLTKQGWVKDVGKQAKGIHKAIDLTIARADMSACDRYLKLVEKAQGSNVVKVSELDKGSDALIANFYKSTRTDRDGLTIIESIGEAALGIYTGKGKGHHSLLNHLQLKVPSDVPSTVETLPLNEIGTLIGVLEEAEDYLSKLTEISGEAELTYLNAMELGEYSGELYSQGDDQPLHQSIMDGCKTVADLAGIVNYDIYYVVYPNVIQAIVATVRANLSNYKGT